ncbi:MAG: tol-pal system YbgF family protein [Candidatus Baltobacteraceae bacterium]
MIAALVLAALTATASAHHAVSTTSAAAQAAFDRGLFLLYAYNGEAAYDAFGRALQADPHLAMAVWGQAIASGSDLNTGMTPGRFTRAHEAAERAAGLTAYASPEERAYIDAAARRYAGTWGDRSADADRYFASMAQLAQTYPHDDDALLFQAEALMEARIDDGQARALIVRVLARNPSQPFANHLCIHSFDYAADHAPELACADRIAAWRLDPAAVHLAHMPAHAYILAGRYDRALKVSESAWQLRQSADAPVKYAAHDAYTGWSVAMMRGDLETALLWAQRTGSAYGGSDIWATWARFEQWDRITGQPAPHEFFAALALGLADLHRGDGAGAATMLRAYKDADADYRWLLEAAIDERTGQDGAAVTALNRALAYQKREDTGEQLPLFPAGEALGAFYYARGRYENAAQAYESTIARFPNDPRALYGLALSQSALGQAVTAAQTMKAFRHVWNAATLPHLGL